MNDRVFGEAEQPQTQESSFSCSTCLNGHKECSLPPGNGQIENKAFSCPECGRKPPRQISLVKRKRRGLEKSYTCDACGKEFECKENLVVHFKVHRGEKDYVCGVCGKRFAQKHTLKFHNRIHSGEKNYECGLCERKFAYKRTLTAHIKIHDIERSDLTCSDCGEVFSLRASLATHRRVHARHGSVSEKLKTYLKSATHYADGGFFCDICNKKFTLKSSLRNHAGIHTGEKRFVCEYCGKRFREKTHLNTHTTIHTGEKKHACDDCGKRFSTKSHLRVHARSHTGEKNFACGECGKRYFIKSHLNDHIRKHTGQKYTCDVCGHLFNDIRYLKLHRKKHLEAEERKPNEKKVDDRKIVCMAEMKESDICKEELSDETLLIAHCGGHEKTSISAFSALKRLKSALPLRDGSPVVLDAQNVTNDTPHLNNIYETNSSTAVKTENTEALSSSVEEAENEALSSSLVKRENLETVVVKTESPPEIVQDIIAGSAFTTDTCFEEQVNHVEQSLLPLLSSNIIKLKEEAAEFSLE